MATLSAASPRSHSRQGWAWALYDWANSAVVTVVIAAVFPVFYNQVIAADLGTNAASAFSFIGAAALILSIVASPLIGTLADVTGRNKQLLVISTLVGSLAVIALFTTTRGGWVWGSALFIITQIALNISFTLYNALLLRVGDADRRDQLSSLGFALGYIGGGIHLAICAYLIASPATFGITAATPGQATETATRIALASAGVWWLLFSIPLFLTVRDRTGESPVNTVDAPVIDTSFRTAVNRIAATFRSLSRYRQLLLMLIAFWLYGDGIGTIIGLATTFGSQQLQLTQTTLIGALLLTQFVAFPYSIFFGQIAHESSPNRGFYVALLIWNVVTFPLMAIFISSAQYAEALPALAAGERFPDRPTVTLTYLFANQVIGLLFCWFVGRRIAEPYAARMTAKSTIMLGLGIYTLITIWGFFAYTPADFWMIAWLVGTVQGGTQALSRSLFASLSPRSKAGEFFGFYSLTEKFGSVFGLILFGAIGVATGGNLRFSIISVIIFFVAGGYLLSRVNVAEGVAIAQAED